MIVATEEMSKPLLPGALALNGTVISKRSSIAKMLSTNPRLSIASSSSVLSNAYIRRVEKRLFCNDLNYGFFDLHLRVPSVIGLGVN